MINITKPGAKNETADINLKPVTTKEMNVNKTEDDANDIDVGNRTAHVSDATTSATIATNVDNSSYVTSSSAPDNAAVISNLNTVPK